MTPLAMTLMFTVLSASPTAGVALGKRSGASRSVAMQRTQLVQQALGAAVPTRVEDFTTCAGRQPCLIKSARDRGWSALVVVETASLLGDAIVNVRLLSIEDDGKQLASVSVQSSDAKLSVALPTQLSSVRQALEQLLRGPSESAPETPRVEVLPPPAVEPTVKSPPPPPPPLVAAASEPASRPAARWIPFGVSLALTVGGAVSFGLSKSIASQLRSENIDARSIDGLVNSGTISQQLGLVGLVGGAVLSVGSLALALLWPETPLKVTAFLSHGGGGMGLVGVWQ